MKSNFDDAFDLVIGHEGGYTNNHQDRGNWTSGHIGVGVNKGTKYGVSAMAYPDLDIKNLTLEQAKEIYRRDYWSNIRANDLPAGVDYLMFDMAVNHGPRQAAKFLQAALGVTTDGIIGPKTMNAMDDAAPIYLISRMTASRINFYISLSSFKTFGKGWIARAVDSTIAATAFALDASKVEPDEEQEDDE